MAEPIHYQKIYYTRIGNKSAELKAYPHQEPLQVLQHLHYGEVLLLEDWHKRCGKPVSKERFLSSLSELLEQDFVAEVDAPLQH